MTETADGIDEVSDVTDEQAAAAEEIAATIDGVVEQSNRVTEAMRELAAESEHQSEAVETVERTVRRLAADEDGGGVRGASSLTDGGRSLPEGLPDGMPGFVIDRLSDEELRAIAAGELEMDDLR